MTTHTPQAGSADPSTRLAFFRLVTGHYLSHATYVAARLGLADLLADGPRQADELARATGTHGPSLRRLLRLLVSAGVLAETDAERFALTPLGDCLRTGTPGSSHATALLFAGPIMRSWYDLMYSVRTGEPAFERTFGMKPFEYMAQHPDEAAVFNEAMTAVSTQAAAAVAATYDFSSCRAVMDVGGGHGVLLGAILGAYPGLRGVLFELPPVAEGARKRLAAGGFGDRCEVVAGDFFESVPAGADVCVLKSVIHDWDDARSVRILRNCHRALPPGGKLLLVELVLPARVDSSPRAQIATGSDVNMLVNVGGRERTEQEFAALFQAAGFELTRILPLEGALSSVLEGVRTQ
jgi:SAM-dependent methyltransferase